MLKDKAFSNTSTMPMATAAISNLTNREFTIEEFEENGNVIAYTVTLDDGKRETITQFSKENKQFLDEAQLPILAQLRWDGWRYTLIAA